MELVAEPVFKLNLISRPFLCLHICSPRSYFLIISQGYSHFFFSLLLLSGTMKLLPYFQVSSKKVHTSLLALTIECSPLPIGFFHLDVLISKSNSRPNLPPSSSIFLLSLFPIVTALFFLDLKRWW